MAVNDVGVLAEAADDIAAMIHPPYDATRLALEVRVLETLAAGFGMAGNQDVESCLFAMRDIAEEEAESHE